MGDMVMGMLQRIHEKAGVSKVLTLAAMGVFAIAGISQQSHAALVATDNAGNYSSTNPWDNGSNSTGSNFGDWNFSANANGGAAGTYLDTSNKAIATVGNTWGVYANGGNGTSNINISRGFLTATGAAGGTLRDGQTFLIEMESDGIGSGGNAFGFNLQTMSGSTVTTPFTLKYQSGGTDAMTVIDASNPTGYSLSGVTFSDLNGGIAAFVTLGGFVPGGNQSYTLVIDNNAGNQLVSYSGQLAGALNQFEGFDTNTTGNGYFNNITITGSPVVATPTPASFGLVLAGGIGLAGLAIRRRSTVART
jgi:hypothetical protein